MERTRSDGVVRLGPFEDIDASVVAAGDSDPEHRRRFDIPDDFTPSVEHARAVIARWRQEARAGTRFPFAVRDAETGELLGGCELLPVGADVANVSYWTYPVHRGQGVATRAVGLICELARDNTEFRVLEIVTDADNTGSGRVALRNQFEEIGARDARVLFVRNLEVRDHSARDAE